MEWDRQAAGAAYADALTGMRDLADAVDDARWHDPTDLPGWDVQDGFAHVASGEATLLGRVDPEHEPDFATLPHCGDSRLKQFIERGVDLRRSRSPQEVRAELDEVVAQRLTFALDLPSDPEALVTGVLGKPRPVAGVVSIRAFDIWTHEQDVRRAVGLEERLTGPAAEVSLRRIRTALPDVVTELSLHDGTTVRWVVTGPLELRVAVTVTDDGALETGDDAEADVTMTTDWSTFARLATGRLEPSHARVAVDGDVSVAEKVLGNLAITP